ncbi:hypothetical protein M5G07_08070 [Serratia symbiotica]|nr:hypothetical protein [Serratia symbiotica]MCP1065491.1 hypothetical protein [Serratia symbiotica]
MVSLGAVLAAGSKIVQDSAPRTIAWLLPAYQVQTGRQPLYRQRCRRRVDSQGNTSDPIETRVTVQSPLIDTNSSALTPRHSTLMEDGKSSQLLTMVLKDMQGQPLEMLLADIHMAVSALKSAYVSAVTKSRLGSIK